MHVNALSEVMKFYLWHGDMTFILPVAYAMLHSLIASSFLSSTCQTQSKHQNCTYFSSFTCRRFPYRVSCRTLCVFSPMIQISSELGTSINTQTLCSPKSCSFTEGIVSIVLSYLRSAEQPRRSKHPSHVPRHRRPWISSVCSQPWLSSTGQGMRQGLAGKAQRKALESSKLIFNDLLDWRHPITSLGISQLPTEGLYLKTMKSYTVCSNLRCDETRLAAQSSCPVSRYLFGLRQRALAWNEDLYPSIDSIDLAKSGCCHL